MTLAELLRHARASEVLVRDSLSGDCIMRGTESSVLHTENCEDYIVEFFMATTFDKDPVILVEVL